MNLKNIILIIVIGMNFCNISTFAKKAQQKNNDFAVWPNHQTRYITIPKNYSRCLARPPHDSDKTPTTPDIIEHGYGGFFSLSRSFGRKRIFFGKDSRGNPCYARIMEHEEMSPEFGNTNLVIFHPTSWYRFNTSDKFEFIGKYADEQARKKFINAMSGFGPFSRGKGGIWLPEINTFIAGTRDKNIGTKFTQYIKNMSINK